MVKKSWNYYDEIYYHFMKKNILIWLLTILWLLTINIFDILWFFYNSKWNSEYIKWNFQTAYNNYKTANNLQNNVILKYNIANTYYKQNDFQKALTFYNYALSESPNCEKEPDFCFLNYHNIWNTYYRLWEKNNDWEQKKSLRNQAITSYKKALNIKHDQETKENLEFVQKKLDEVNAKDLSSQSWDNQQNQNLSWSKDGDSLGLEQWSWDQSTQSLDNQWSWNQQNQNTWNESKDADSSWTKWTDSSRLNNSGNDLSKDQEKKLQDYMQYLKQEELKNQWNFNKKPQDSNPQQDIFSQFFGNNPFFDNGALNNDGKKDW